MAYAKIAVVNGEWQFDPDQVIRLYVRPTLTLINRAGETHHVPAFGYFARRPSGPQYSETGIELPPSSYTSSAVGAGHWQSYTADNQKRLEPVTPYTLHNLGELVDNCSPIMALLFIKTNVLVNPLHMSAEAVCIDEAYAIGEYDEPLINLLKGIATCQNTRRC